ncbi:outer membrane protein, OMP85 family [Salmonella bongori]|nr:outer membrane protein, OMP85 family [Salmonella bongori]
MVSPRTENTIETGVGYSTDVGPRVKASWKKPWMNSYGHSLTTSTSISAPEQVLDFSYKMPLLKNPLEQYYLVQGGFKRTDLNDTEQDSTTLAVSRYWDLSSGWQRAINLRWSFDHFTQGNVTNTTMLFLPGRDDQPHPLTGGPDANLGRFAALLGGLLEYRLGFRCGLLRTAGTKRLDSYFVRSPPFRDARQFRLDRNR